MLGNAYVQIMPQADGIKGAISNVLGGEAESAGTTIGGKIGAFAKKAIIATGIGTVAVKGIKAAMTQGAELEQNIGGAYAVFGDKLYGTLEKQASQAYKNMGMSASDYYATANKMGSLFQGSGLSQQKSLDLTSQAMQRAADVASVMGLDTSAAMESIAGAAKGNFTMMDNLGVAMNATTLEAYALEKGMNFKWNTASNAEKAELAMKMFMDRTSQYAGNFARESSETFSGSLGAMKASYQDFLGSLALGEGVSQSMSALVDTATTFFFGNFIPTLGKILKSLPKAIAMFLRKGLPLLVKSVISLIKNLTKSIEKFADGVTGSSVAQWAKQNIPRILEAGGKLMLSLVKAIVINLPKIVAAIGKVALAILTGLGATLWNKVKDLFVKGWNAVITVTTTFLTNIKTKITAGFNAVKTAISNAVNAIKTKITTTFTAIRTSVTTIWTAIKTNISNIVTAIKTKISNTWTSIKTSVSNAVNSIKTKVSSTFSAVKSNVSSVWNSIKTAITSPITSAKATVSSIVSTIKSTVSGAFNGISSKVRAAFDAVKTAITSPIQTAKDLVSSAISTIKGLFPISLGKIFSGIKLPHFNISGGQVPWGIGGAGTPPSVSISWYKQGGIMTQPTVFHVGGDAGPEAILPLTPFWKKMDEIANNVQGGNTINIYVNGADKDPREIAEEVKRVLIRDVNSRRLAWQ